VGGIHTGPWPCLPLTTPHLPHSTHSIPATIFNIRFVFSIYATLNALNTSYNIQYQARVFNICHTQRTQYQLQYSISCSCFQYLPHSRHSIPATIFNIRLVFSIFATLKALNTIYNIQSYLIFVVFFTRAKFLENEIYTKKRQFFALNL